MHFARPGWYESVIPRQLPGTPRSWVLGSGVAELACAGAVASPRTRRLGAQASALLFVAVFPANVQMVINYRRAHKPFWQQAVAVARLPLQWPMIALALRVGDNVENGTLEHTQA